MQRQELRTLYEHNDWANDRLIQMLYQAFGEEWDLRQSAEPVVQAIQTTAVHIFAAQAIWRERWQGKSPTAMLDPADYPTPLAIRMGFGAERARFWGFFATLENDENDENSNSGANDARLDEIIEAKSTTGEPRRLPLGQMMQHVLLHSAYHRGQITARLIDLGKEDVVQSTDLLPFYLERQARSR